MNAQLLPPSTPASISQFAPGIYPDIPAELYHKREMGVANAGALKILNSKTPAHYRAWLDAEQDDDTKALEFGRALHCALLEPKVFDATYVQPVEHPFRRPSITQRNAKKPSHSTLEAIAYWDKWEADHVGLIEITAAEKQRLIGMAESIRQHPIARTLLSEGASEQTLVWIDPRTGLLCKARVDRYIGARGLAWDLKSTEDASERGFAQHIARYGYHIQDAHYAGGFQVLGLDLRAFLFVAVEKEPPYAVAVHSIDPEAESRGIELRDRAMDTLARCVANNSFPGYEPRINRLSLPVWALRD